MRRRSRERAEARAALLDKPDERAGDARSVMADRVLLEPEVPRTAPFVDDRRRDRTHPELGDPSQLLGGRLEVWETALGVMRAEMIGRRIVIDQRDVEARAAEVVPHDAHVVGDAEAVGLPG